jgi:long-chain acyl-CoA synthetase
LIIADFLRISAKAHPEKAALSFEGKHHTYGDLDAMTDRIAGRMRDMGIAKGDRVLIGTGNVPQTVLSIFGAAKCGAIFVPINPRLKEEKVRSIIRKCEPGLAIIEGTTLPESVPIIVSLYDGAGEVLHFKDLITGGSESLPPGPTDIDVAAIMFTSGSTGEQKGVTLTNGNIDSASDSIIRYLENVPEDVIIDPIPLSFDYGLYQVLMGFKFGGRVVLERSFVFFNNLLQRVGEEGVTGFPLVPSMAEIILSKCRSEDYDLSSIRYVTNTAQALNPATIKGLQEFFKGARIYSMYGLTECKRASYLDPDKLSRKPTSVGMAIPNTEIFIIDEERRRVPEPGKVGELVVKGPHVMVGYWNDPESTAKVIIDAEDPRDRALLTGDLFSFDEEGDYYYVGRKDEMLKIGGEKASPIEVERAIGGIKGVSSCVVIGVPDDLMGNALVAVVVASDGVDETEVKRACAEKLERHLVPKRIAFAKDLPLTQNGKVDRKSVARNIEEYLRG